MKKLNTNSNEVRKAVQDHIKAYYENIDDLRRELDNLNDGRIIRSIYQAGAYMVQGGCFLIYYGDVKDFLNGLGINPTNKEYTDEKSWELYKHLIAINAERLYNGKGVK
jgi:hypothetical protein